jgi:hypothetical protein
MHVPLNVKFFLTRYVILQEHIRDGPLTYKGPSSLFTTVAVVIVVVTSKHLQADRKVKLHCCETEELSVDLTVNAFRSGVHNCLTFGAYLSGQVVTLALKIVLQNGRNFMEVIQAHRQCCVFVPAE